MANLRVSNTARFGSDSVQKLPAQIGETLTGKDEGNTEGKISRNGHPRNDSELRTLDGRKFITRRL